MKNYGKGIVESLSTPEYKQIERQMIIPVISVLLREGGFSGLLKLFFNWRSENSKMKSYNWSRIEKKGIVRAVLESTMQYIALMKTLDEMFGIDKAKGVITDIYKKTEAKLKKKHSAVNLFLYPIKELEKCNDRFACFKEYTKGMEEAGMREKFHEAEIIEDSKEVLAFNVNYCVAHEVAKEYGNPDWSFPWCELDDVVYPNMGLQLGFKYTRSGNLPTGASKCDFRFKRSG
ncbi:MAG: L-2-amino-thiazoline-4-carboxylic acid hydrolase [Proteobacteria bacterium]|nr:L-2-amino-thiazoline-4-carboxylic acid hydrolase [Pseudomonadota bacterium]